MSRRRFLRSLGLGAMALPFVPLLDVHAGSEPPPKRVVFFFSSNGTIPEHWTPSMKDGKLVLSTILSPLERHKGRLLVVDGLDHTVIMEKGDFTGHSAGMNTALTGRKAKFINPSDPLHTLATGISLDQYVAKKLSAGTKLASIEAGVQVRHFVPDLSALSFGGPSQPIYAENNPERVFERLFRGFSEPNVASSAAEIERRKDRALVLDAVAKNLSAVSGTLSAGDRTKMEAHIGAVRALDHGLSTSRGSVALQSCGKPKLGPRIDNDRNDNIPAVSRTQMDLLVMALACDLTRVCTIQFGRGGAAHRFNWLGPEFATDPALAVTDQATGFHALAHKETDSVSREKLVKIHTWYAGELAYLLDKLAAIPERNGTMLDNTLVVWVNELGSGGSHSHDKTPWLLAGNVNGYFKTGQLVSFPGQPHNRLLLSICNALGFEGKDFGDPDYNKSGALTGVTV